MRPSIARSLGWLMNDLIPALRGRPGSTAVHVRHEIAGAAHHGPSVPASADAVVVEVRLRLPPAARRKDDYALRIPGRGPLAAESLRTDDADPRRYRLTFRFAPPEFTARAELLWRNKLLVDVAIPIQSTNDFLDRLSVSLAATSVQLADRTVAARAFVAAQCRGFHASIVLSSPTALAPLVDLGVRVAVRCDRTAGEQVVPVSLAHAQAIAKDAILVAALPRPRRAGTYSVIWSAGGRELAALRVRVVSEKEFVRSLRLADARFVVIDPTGEKRFARHAPTEMDGARVGPCFVLASALPGAAALLALDAVAQPAEPPLALSGTALVTDGPTVFAPGSFDATTFAPCARIELRAKSHALGTLARHPVPTAAFDAEGGFQPPPDFAWTTTAEEELAERLAKLLEGE